MTLPALTDWENTRAGLHRAAQVLGAVRKVSVEPQPNWLHLALDITAEGATTGPLSFGGELALDYPRRRVVYRREGLPSVEINLEGHNQATLAGAVLDVLAQARHHPPVPRDSAADLTPFDIHPDLAADFNRAQYRMFTALARFRARLLGGLSPIVLWPHNFDLAFLLFANPELSENGLHAAFGFEPRSPGLERPYVYVYVRPTPDGLTEQPLPAPARWYTEGWTGVVIQYDDLRGENDPEAALENTLMGVYRVIKRYLD